MLSFNDFDAWGETVSGASLRLVCDGVETPAWTLGVLELGDVVLQIATEGGGNLCYGENTHPGPTIFLPLTSVGDHVVNGVALDEDSLLAIPRGADFSIRIRRKAHAWCSIALPAFGPLATLPLSGSTRLACRPGAVRVLKRLAAKIAASLLDRPSGTAAHRAAGDALFEAAVSCLVAPEVQRSGRGRPRLDRAAIMRRAMEAIDAGPTLPSAAELARAIDINERTLLRAFRETFGVPTKQYLMFREMHLIRRILSTGAPAASTVADVLARQGIWEFGRFSGRYRGHFGESPSETLRRARS